LLVELYPAVDIEGGRVARSTSASDPIAAVRQFARDGARWVHVVDLDRAFGKGENRELTRRLLAEAAVRIQVGGGVTSDGSLAGPDVDGARAIAALGEGLDVIVSGGVASLDDLRRVRDAGLAGAIVGRALHEGRFTLHEALTCIAA